MVEHNLRQLARIQAQQAASVPLPPSPAAPARPVCHSQPKPRRNDPCPCGSGKKFKKCCGA
ncbi:MAG: SEC-C metal-binding domain-containing protein [Verrucomicrobiota bacterium]